MTTPTDCTLAAALAELLDTCRYGEWHPEHPYLFAFFPDSSVPFDVTPDTDAVATSIGTWLLSLAERLYAGNPLTIDGRPLPPPQAMALLHTESDRITGDTTIRVIDAIDIHGHALTASLDPYRPGTRVAIQQRANLIHLRRLLYAATRKPQVLDHTDLAMVTPFELVTRTAGTVIAAFPTPVDPADPHAISERAAHLAAIAMAVAAPARIDWQEAIQAAAVEPAALREWLDHTARLLAIDLMQVLSALAWDQLNDLSGSPLRALTNEAHHLGEITEIWLRLQEERDALVAAAVRIADRCAVLDHPPADPAKQPTP